MRGSWARLVVGAILVVVGIGWLLQEAGLVDIPLEALAPIALIVIGIGLVAGANRGSHTGLIVAGAILTLILATDSSAGNRAEREIRPSDNIERPLTANDIHPYRLGAGTITVDLTRLELTRRTYKVDVRVKAGQIRVLVPTDVPLRVNARTGAGSLDAVGSHRSGIGVSISTVEGDYGSSKPRIDLHLRAGVGTIRVDRESVMKESARAA